MKRGPIALDVTAPSYLDATKKAYSTTGVFRCRIAGRRGQPTTSDYFYLDR